MIVQTVEEQANVRVSNFEMWSLIFEAKLLGSNSQNFFLIDSLHFLTSASVCPSASRHCDLILFLSNTESYVLGAKHQFWVHIHVLVENGLNFRAIWLAHNS